MHIAARRGLTTAGQGSGRATGGNKSGILRHLDHQSEVVPVFPNIRQKLVVLLAVLAGGWAWGWAAGLLAAADGSTGISLVSGRLAMPMALAVVVLAGLPAIGLGGVASACSNTICGLFVVALSLCVLAAHGGSMQGWVLRTDHASAGYLALAMEMLVWQAGVLLLLVLIGSMRRRARARWPAVALDDRPDTVLSVWFGRPWSIRAALVSAAVAAVVASCLIRSADGGQVIGSLLVAFALGGIAAGALFPGCSPLGVVCGPAVVAIAAYLWVAFQFAGDEQAEFLGAWYLRQGTGSGRGLPGVALALPIHYVSAGIVGCCLGIGIGAGVEKFDKG